MNLVGSQGDVSHDVVDSNEAWTETKGLPSRDSGLQGGITGDSSPCTEQRPLGLWPPAVTAEGSLWRVSKQECKGSRRNNKRLVADEGDNDVWTEYSMGR